MKPASSISSSKALVHPATSFAIGPRIALGIALIGLLVLGGGGWAATADLSGAVIAPGSLVVERHTKKIQHLDGGIVAEIAVKDGDSVGAGQLLVRLDPTQTRAELGIIESQLVELTGRRTRLSAERDGAAILAFPADFGAGIADARQTAEGETRLFRDNLRMRESQKEQIGLRIGQLEQEIGGLSAQLRAKMAELQLVETELRQMRDLADRALAPRTRVYTLEREATRLTGENGSLVAQIARANGQISELNLQILTIDQSARTEAQRELRTIAARLSELSERRAAARDRLERMDIRSPQSGLVHELAAHTVGGIITPAAHILSIVPEGEKLAIEVRLSPVDIDQVAIGQSARLRFSAFNHRTTTEVAAQIVHIAADVTQDGKSGAAYYIARLAIDQEARAQLGEVKLLPGMPVEAFITTGDRKAMTYLLKPLLDQFARAFREE